HRTFQFHILGQVDLSHTTRTNVGANLVAAKTCAGVKHHLTVYWAKKVFLRRGLYYTGLKSQDLKCLGSAKIPVDWSFLIDEYSNDPGPSAIESDGFFKSERLFKHPWFLSVEWYQWSRSSG